MGKIIGVYNQKGGAGKTTTVINVSSFFEEDGCDVLGVDADDQGSFTSALLGPSFISDNNQYLSDLILSDDLTVKDVVCPVSIQMRSKGQPKRVHIDVIPSSKNEEEKKYTDPYLLKKKLEQVRDNYDYIIIDFPPRKPYADFENNDYNIVTLALCSLDELLVPCTTDGDSLDGYYTLLKHVNILKSYADINLLKTSFFINAYLSEYKSERDFKECCEELPGYSNIVIPHSGILKNSRMKNRPLAWFNSNSSVAEAYKELAKYISR